MSRSSTTDSGSGCVLWLILAALVVIILLMVGFSGEDAVKYGASGVAAFWAFLAAAPCGILCFIMSLLALLFGGVWRDIHTR